MNTRVVPIDELKRVYLHAYSVGFSGATKDGALRGSLSKHENGLLAVAALFGEAAAPPQPEPADDQPRFDPREAVAYAREMGLPTEFPEPADHLAAPDSRERALHAPTVIDIEILWSKYKTGSQESRSSHSNECPADGLAPVAAPVLPRLENWKHCYDESRSPNLEGSVYGHPRIADSTYVYTSTLKTIDEIAGTAQTRNTLYRLGKAAPDAHLREQIADAQARKAEVGRQLDAGGILFGGEPAERRVAQRRFKETVAGSPLQRFGLYDRRQNAAGQVQVETPVVIGPEPVLAAPAHNDHPLRHYDRTCPACNAPASTLPLNANLKSEWFRKGQESVRRENESGCCCKIDDDGDTILSACEAHSEWAQRQVAERDAEIAKLDKNVQRKFRDMAREISRLKMKAGRAHDQMVISQARSKEEHLGRKTAEHGLRGLQQRAEKAERTAMDMMAELAELKARK